ncbi:DoxX family protein [Flavobacterium sp. MAH-1]|uniref:DoxX family protein n=1 Tax=Flavobacterium agri TaxID=2743471 RepID=A0A7Y9C4M4_9FLAO|nr:DoxX family protein [Flavobacterium agri]NUY80025.1 DoxX family protein [Flavobacterium agri]NYA70050.1 DoxX family protein [Flavobacterium agri]
MYNVKSLNKWANAHTSYPLDALRIALGVFLFITGVLFIKNSQAVADVVSQLSNFDGGMFAFHYVAAAHIMGGIMIVFGLLTRWAIIAQLPILVCAVALNFIVEMSVRNLLFSSIALIICVFFLFYGSGKHSADYYFKMQK